VFDLDKTLSLLLKIIWGPLSASQLTVWTEYYLSFKPLYVLEVEDITGSPPVGAEKAYRPSGSDNDPTIHLKGMLRNRNILLPVCDSDKSIIIQI